MTNDDKFTAMLREQESECRRRQFDLLSSSNRNEAATCKRQAADWAALRERYVAMREALKKANAECENDPGNLFLSLDTWTEIKQALEKAGA